MANENDLKEFLKNPNLSWKAKGIFSHLLTLSDDRGTYIEQLKEVSSDGRDSTAAGIHELEKMGYISRSKIRDLTGKYTIIKTTIHKS